jgi:hypothetical protein
MVTFEETALPTNRPLIDKGYLKYPGLYKKKIIDIWHISQIRPTKQVFIYWALVW